MWKHSTAGLAEVAPRKRISPYESEGKPQRGISIRCGIFALGEAPSSCVDAVKQEEGVREETSTRGGIGRRLAEPRWLLRRQGQGPAAGRDQGLIV